LKNSTQDAAETRTLADTVCWRAEVDAAETRKLADTVCWRAEVDAAETRKLADRMLEGRWWMLQKPERAGRQEPATKGPKLEH
jgi:hypothetical protein